MKTLIAMAFAAAIATPALSQEHKFTKALVGMVVAEQYCHINAPVDFAKQTGINAMAETGLDTQQMIEATYTAAQAIATEYARTGQLTRFCASVGVIYGRMQPNPPRQ